MTDGNADMSRRAFLRTAAGTTALAGAAGTAAAQEEGGSGGGGGGGGTKTVKVGPGGSLVFTPGTEEALKVTPGTTVNFVWESDNHNIVVESQPEGAGWEGTKGGKNKTYDTGHEYSYTFETKGKYEYFCQPHKTAGMIATIEVVESLQEESGPSLPQVPQGAKALGVASTFSMVATLGLTYFFVKYGGDYPTDE